MISTFHETKRYKKQNEEYFWFKNEDYYEYEFNLYTGMVTSSPEYSYDKVNWVSGNDWRIKLKPGQKVYMRCSSGYLNDEYGYIYPNSGVFGKMSVGGPLASLIDYTDMSNVTTIPQFCFYNLLFGTTTNNSVRISNNIIDISQIDFGNITTLGKGSLQGAFAYTNTKKIPDLSGIETIGENSMYKSFYWCESLEDAYFESSATTVGMYGMYECFNGCVNIKKAPDLSSITTLSYYALQRMYYNCSNLEDITVPNVSTWDTGYSYNWVYNVKTSGVMHCPTGVTIPVGIDGIPSGWTRDDY